MGEKYEEYGSCVSRQPLKTTATDAPRPSKAQGLVPFGKELL